MKRGFQVLVVVFALVSFWWVLTPPPITAPAVKAEVIQVTSERVPASTVVLRPPLKNKASKKPSPGHDPIQLDEHVAPIDDARAPITQGRHRWRFLAGVSAIAVDAHDPLARLSGYAIVNSADVPAGVEALSLVKREDNGLVGIFTGVIRAVGEKGQSQGSFLSECSQGHIQESYPALKSYLLKSNPDQDAQEYFQCLSGLGRFKTLNWEILDHPRSGR